MNYVNCTPHPIRWNNNGEIITIEPSGHLARVQTTVSEYDADGIATRSIGALEGLPEIESDTYYIVSSMCLAAANHRAVIAPDTGSAVRDANGHIDYVHGFVRELR